MGHSTHPIDEFVALLERAAIEMIADVRRYPGSRRNPQFGSSALARSLQSTGIGYRQLGDSLGGRRSPDPGRADNAAWREPSFRAYADHMSSAEFLAGLEVLEPMARERRSAIMCAEAHPSRCHRRLIADALVARGWRVVHLLADGRRETHALSPHAVVDAGRVTYPAQPTLGI
ncbi:MAG: DUF488 family protein [Solirubrobacterales bacterium]